MRGFMLILLVIIVNCTLSGQTYYTRTGHIKSASKSKFLDLVADNYQVAAKVLPAEGLLEIDALIKSFEFDMKLTNRLMSGKGVEVVEYPKITYRGKFKPINLSKPGTTMTIPVTGVLKAWNMERITTAEVMVKIDATGQVEAFCKLDMLIEESSVKKFNDLMKRYIPSQFNFSADNLGIDRRIYIDAQLKLLKR
jgi:hypothetical protein